MTMTYNEIVENDEKYFMPIYGPRFPLAVDHGKGCYLYDTENNEYLDFVAGIATNCLGYVDEGFTKALTNQINKVIHCSNYYYNEPQAELVEKLCNLAGEDYKCFICNSGGEANETAIKLVRKHFHKENKYGILSLRNSFHGRTLATLSATGQDHFHTSFTPLPPEFDYFSTIEELNSKINPNLGGVILEMIQGEGGVNPLDKGFVKNIAQICKDNDILLIVDEIQTGMGRTGTMFGFEQYDIEPDIFTLAKALGGGVPIGACLTKSHITFKKGEHGSTFGGNPLACTAANYICDKIDANMLAHVNEMSDYLFEKLKPLNPRGKGLLLGFTLEGINNREFVLKCIEKGLLLATAGFNTVRLAPPFIITKANIDKCVEIIFETLKEFQESEVSE